MTQTVHKAALRDWIEMLNAVHLAWSQQVIFASAPLHITAPVLQAHLAWTERVLLTLKAEELIARLDAGFEAAYRAGLLTEDKVQEAIKQARAAHPYR